jgi:hypothetical protein
MAQIPKVAQQNMWSLFFLPPSPSWAKCTVVTLCKSLGRAPFPLELPNSVQPWRKYGHTLQFGRMDKKATDQLADGLGPTPVQPWGEMREFIRDQVRKRERPQNFIRGNWIQLQSNLFSNATLFLQIEHKFDTATYCIPYYHTIKSLWNRRKGRVGERLLIISGKKTQVWVCVCVGVCVGVCVCVCVGAGVDSWSHPKRDGIHFSPPPVPTLYSRAYVA